MKIKFIPYFCFLLPLLFVSCTKVIDFEGDTPAQMLVMNCIVNPDSVVRVHLSKSKFFLSSSDGFQNVENAQVFLTINGSPNVLLNHRSEGVYESITKLSPNDLVLITATAPNLKSVSASVLIQPQVTILDIDTTQVNLADRIPIYATNDFYSQNIDTSIIGYGYYREVRLKIKFQDNVKERNFYRVNASQLSRNATGKALQGTQYYYNFGVDYDDVVFGNNAKEDASLDVSTGGTNNLFTDETLNGKEYLLSLKTTIRTNVYLPGKAPAGTLEEEPLDLVIDFQQLSKEYYLYYKTTLASNPGDFFSEPVQIYNNIQDGLGILGSYSHTIRKYQLQ